MRLIIPQAPPLPSARLRCKRTVTPPTEILVIALDTTQRKRVEVAEQTAQRVLEHALQAANVGLWDLDLQTNRMHYSHQWKQQLGYADDEIGDSLDEWERRLHPDDRERARNLAFAHIATARPNYEQEFRLQHKDGSYRWILARGTIYYDADGTPAHAIGVHIDITEKKLAADMLTESLAAERDRLAAILESLPAGVWIATQDGKLIAKNRQADVIWRGNGPLSASVDEYTEYTAWDVQNGPVRSDEPGCRPWQAARLPALVSAGLLLDSPDVRQLCGCLGLSSQRVGPAGAAFTPGFCTWIGRRSCI